MSDELKACPKCGESTARIKGWEIWFRGECGACRYAPDWWEDTKEEAADFWNARPLEDALLARAEHAKAMTVRFMDLCVDMAGSGYYNPDFIDRYNAIYREWKEGKQ